MSAETKIVSLGQLLDLRLRAKKEGKTVVHCHGCFDIVHPGHVHHLEFARSLGDILIVSVSSDQNVSKGPSRPLIPDDLRARSLAALQCVDAVYLNTKPTSEGLLESLRPDIYVKGREYETSKDPRFLRERDTVIQNGGRVVFSGGDVVYSSTALINSMQGTQLFDGEKIRRYRDRHGLSAESLQNLVQRFRGKKVVVVGDYILDRYHFCESIGVASESPSTLSLRDLQQVDYDGGAGVIARHACAMGARTTLITTMASDEESHNARQRLLHAGMNIVSHGRRQNTITKERFLVEEHKAFRVESGTSWANDSTASDDLAHSILEALHQADALIFADFGYGTITNSLVANVMHELRPGNARQGRLSGGVFGGVNVIAADVSGMSAGLKKFRGVDLITPTEREARHSVGDQAMGAGVGAGLGAVAGTLLHDLNIASAIFTLGKQGLVTFDRASGEHDAQGETDRLASDYLPSMATRALDPLGCGDALLTAATLALASGGTLAAAAFVGSLAAAVEVSHVGNVPVDADALLDLIGQPARNRLAS